MRFSRYQFRGTVTPSFLSNRLGAGPKNHLLKPLVKKSKNIQVLRFSFLNSWFFLAVPRFVIAFKLVLKLHYLHFSFSSFSTSFTRFSPEIPHYASIIT